ncbi:MAG: DUF2007 domain-containing protein [Leptospiraceae bacterium]
MKQVYRSANEFEAQMYCNLLEQAGIEAHISGDQIQGFGASPQPIQIFVAEEDYEQASRIIAEGSADSLEQDKLQNERFGRARTVDSMTIVPEISSSTVSEGLNHTSARETDWVGVFMGAIVGIMLGAGGMFWAYNSPVEENGIDFDGDGRLDETWIYVDDRISRVDFDSNRDGKVDEISHYDHQELLEFVQSDDDLNGTFETEYRYEDGNLSSYRQDMDDDGFFEYQEHIRPNGITEGTYFHPQTRMPIKTISYDSFQMLESRLDLDGDGRMDVLRKHNEIDEIISEEEIR